MSTDLGWKIIELHEGKAFQVSKFWARTSLFVINFCSINLFIPKIKDNVNKTEFTAFLWIAKPDFSKKEEQEENISKRTFSNHSFRIKFWSRISALILYFHIYSVSFPNWNLKMEKCPFPPLQPRHWSLILLLFWFTLSFNYTAFVILK